MIILVVCVDLELKEYQREKGAADQARHRRKFELRKELARLV
uniref:Uncharacterized protein n=1 Tax=Arundo donax TaxID=35708 RepID=A0A0A9DC59_ARUDO